jgi:peptide/nickel transport system permease protein
MTTYIIRRLLETIPVLFGVSVLVFLFVHIIPGDPAVTLLGERATDENVERIRERLGLNKPIFLNFKGSEATLLADSATLYEDPDGEEEAEIDIEYALTILAREEGWVKVNAVIREELMGWVQDPDATVNNSGRVSFSQERLRAFDEPVERGAKRLGSIEAEELTFLNEGEDGWYEVAWTKEKDRRVGWLPEAAVDVIVRPFDSQYVIYMKNILSGDLGHTIQGNIPIANELRRRLPATMELSLYALLLAVVIGIPIGVLSAVWRNSLLDVFSMIGALVGVSMPIFWLGLVLIFIFSIQLRVLPMVGRVDVDTDLARITGFLTIDALLRLDWKAFVDVLKHLLMPALVLSTIPVSIIARITRSSMLEVLSQDYVRTARAKGLPKRVAVSKHALRNALLPVTTVVGLQLGNLLSGAVLTETIFSWPGIGRWVFDSILKREYPIIQSVTLIVALMFVLINLLVDVLYAVLNPRIRLS